MDLLPRIEIDGASKTIGNSVVLDQIQLTVKPGEMIGLQGVNGSGKTMLLRLISGLIYPTKGHVLIDGKMLGSDLEFPPSIGFLIENPTFLPQYTGAENLQMLSSLHQMMPTAQIESVLQRVGLHDTKYKKYSLGMKQRLGIAAAVFEQPDIILLDEPTNALDESGITMLENVIQDETSRGATIVMASHDMNFLHHCCSKIYTMRAAHCHCKEVLCYGKKDSLKTEKHHRCVVNSCVSRRFGLLDGGFLPYQSSSVSNP